jgi:hypothetical protein
MLLRSDSEGNTVFHWAAKLGKPVILQEIWYLATNNLTVVEIKNKILSATDNDGKTVWFSAAKLCSQRMSQITCGLTTKNRGDEK